MEIQATGKDVGAGETLERQLCAIGSATDRLHLRHYTGTLHGEFCRVDNVHYGFDFLAHIIVLVLKLEAHAVRELIVHFACKVLKFLLAALKTVAVVVADNVGHHGLFHIALNTHEVIEAFISLSVFGRLPARKHDGKLVGNANGINHLVLCISGVYAETAYVDGC